MYRLATLCLLLVALPALAQTPGDCDLGTASRALDVSIVYGRLFNSGNLFFGNGSVYGDGYVVPVQSAASPLFAANLWVGGTIGGDLRVASAFYGGFEFWPGPLDDGATLPDPNDCSDWDRIWVVSASDLARYETTGEATDDLAAWPVGLGAEAVDASGAPVVPTSREQVVDLEAGERPVVFGSQTAFWVMNDIGNEHLFSHTEPIGLEVQVTAFAVASADQALDTGTFYRYRLVNRNAQPFEDARFGFWQDPDLGDVADDYAGVDTTRSLGFAYNADETDAVYGIPPAFGVDLLDGLDVFNPCQDLGPFSPPISGFDIYNCLRGLGRDGAPITEGGAGGQVLTTFYPGDPVTGQFWSEVNVDGDGTSTLPGDRRWVSASPAFSLAPGEARTFHLALVFGQGTDHLASITELRAVSDRVQAAYDGGALFETVLPDPPVTLAAPNLLAPDDGATFIEKAARFAWSAVAGAVYYRLDLGRDADFVERQSFFTTAPSFEVPPFTLSANDARPYFWRVRAGDADDGLSPFSDTRSFTLYRYAFDYFGLGTGIVEVASPDGTPCPDPGDPGCAAGYPGNTVWLDPDTAGDYVVTNRPSSVYDLIRYPEVIEGDNFEMRFTDACATAGACLGIFPSASPGDGRDEIASVPFELWNTGAEDDDSDEVRMIPFLHAPDDADPTEQWADTFPTTQRVRLGDEVLDLPVTHSVLWMMPDRDDGYDRFAAAAAGFGGPGATYDPDDDGDMMDDAGCDARSQGYYVDFCYRDANSRFVAPIGSTAGMQLADLAGDETTPAVGTVIRFDANERLLTDAEEGAPGQPTAFALGAVYPNPLRAAATVPFEVRMPGRVRLSVYDVLGREVAVLEDGEVAAGVHRAQLDGSRLASGVYLVVLEAAGERQAKKVVLLR